MAALAPALRHSRTLWCARVRCSAPPCPGCPSRRVSCLLLAADLAGLAGLAADHLAGVAHALALVGLGLAGGAHLGRHLADELLVDADDGQLDRGLELEADALGRIDLDLMAVAQAELELLA